MEPLGDVDSVSEQDSRSTQNGSGSQPSVGPVYSVPEDNVVSIEHPCIVHNFENVYKSLGGEAQIKHVLEHHVGDSKLGSKRNQLPEPVVGASLRPNDPFAKRIPSLGIETRNVLLKVTLPKRTGRKRKRGSDDPFSEPTESDHNSVGITAPDLFRRLRDHENAFTIQPVAMLHETHRFRTLPDFQLGNSDITVMQELRKHAMTPDYEKLKQFNMDLRSGSSHITAFPGPPNFTSMDMPHRYEYQQAAGVVFITDEQGEVTWQNLSVPQRRVIWGLAPDAPEVPQGPPANIKKRSSAGENLPHAIEELTKLLAERPLITKRVALNALPPISDTIFKEATQYVGYSFKAGPWRDSLIKYGVDPRKDPKFRFYQTMMFQVDKEAFKAPKGHTSALWARPLRHTQDDPETHIFDGKRVTANGKTWQICDVTDPILYDIFHTDEIRSTCDEFQWGWYHNGTMAKARVIMKDKMKYLFADETPPEEDYRALMSIPEKLTKTNVDESISIMRSYGTRVTNMGADVRNIAKNGNFQRALKLRAQKAAMAELDNDDGDLLDSGDEVDANEDLGGVADNEVNGLLGDDDEDEDGQGDFGDMDDQSDAEADAASEGQGEKQQAA